MKTNNSDFNIMLQFINEKLGSNYQIDSYKPGNVRLYKLTDDTGKSTTYERMTRSEFNAYIIGMSDALALYTALSYK